MTGSAAPAPAPATARTNGARPARAGAATRKDAAIAHFTRAEAVNARQAAEALRPFQPGEFGTGPASPSLAHIQAANGLISKLQQRLRALGGPAHGSPYGTEALQALLARKARAEKATLYVERVWDYFLELFGQRQSRFSDWLLSADRIAQDCYQAVYTGLGAARSVPTPPPFTYMETGFTPATFRRGIALSRLGSQKNPFPIVKLPFHRLVNPWTLGAIHHEVSHNLQSDLDLWNEVPRRIAQRLVTADLDPATSRTWARWHKEIWADLCGLLLGGPAIVASLIGVVSKSPAATLNYNPAGVHPIPYFRVLINVELLRRMGFPNEAAEFQHLWLRLYPSTRAGNIPGPLLASFPRAGRLVVDTICFQPYRQLGDKRLIEVTHFRPAHQKMVEEAAQRISAGTDPGIVPARFLVAAARWALDHKLAPPRRIAAGFYAELAKR